MPSRKKDNNPCRGGIEGIYVQKQLRHRKRQGPDLAVTGGAGPPRGLAAGVCFCECDAVSGKMSTFVSGKKLLFLKRYAEFMSTFVYLLEKPISRKINELTSKNVYFCILLTTFHVGRGGVSCEINGLSATDA